MPSLYAPDTQCDESDKIWFRFTVETQGSIELRIRNLNDVLVRTLTCGTLPMGDYTSRQKAVLWDRTDDDGSRVASGSNYSVQIVFNGSGQGQVVFILR